MPSPRPASSVISPIQQGLADGSPDVDAIWRLVLAKPFRFQSRGQRRTDVRRVVPVQQPEHLVVARGVSADVPAQPSAPSA